MSAETWRVVLDDGSVREVSATCEGDGYAVVNAWPLGSTRGSREHCGTSGRSVSTRAVVAMVAAACRWPVAAILAPGEASAEERIAAAVKAEREACKAAVRDAAAVDDHGAPWCNCLDAISARGG